MIRSKDDIVRAFNQHAEGTPQAPLSWIAANVSQRLGIDVPAIEDAIGYAVTGTEAIG